MGDLAWRKLLPSLSDLYKRRNLPKDVRILGVSREQMSTTTFKDYVAGKVNGVSEEFLDILSYLQMDLLDEEAYHKLGAAILDMEHELGVDVRGNRLFHLAVPPTLYKEVFKNLGNSEVAIEGPTNWSRILVEKPFGYDSESAEELNSIINQYLKETQIFRVDHYLAKDTIENLIAFRFSNALFEHTWDNNHVESVHIKMYESGDVENRGAFYETVGALRDVGQNHLLQLLTLLAMDSPGELNAEKISSMRLGILNSLRVYSSKEEVAKNTFRAQYDSYRDTAGISDNSDTETYFAIRAFVDSPVWQGVSFLIEGGKGMPEDNIEIQVQFKRRTPCVCGVNGEGHEHGNRLTFSLQPQKQISIRFWVKKPGLEYVLESQELKYVYDDSKGLPDAYEQVLRDAILGNRTIFPTAQEVCAAWKFITPIINNWESVPLVSYKKGTMPLLQEFNKNL